MKLTLKKIDNETKVTEQVFTIPHATALHYRQLLKFDETIDYADMSVDDYDKVAGFVCDVFRNQFTVDELYEGIPSHELIPTFTRVFTFVRTGKTPEELAKEQEETKDQDEGNS
ncbi:phage tail assembly chaperone G [Halalkalibacterium halodurans]|uniref:phage tail assembly chaperone G n=1 Tax=Halalkalibacterium halodurans TaxID=86665 RepID=UPI002E239B72|nr:hypothetical protein [Halalkalibacterium halodurans]MED4162479.1 hypothetical protein [Halalkalibacterium halodurans]